MTYSPEELAALKRVGTILLAIKLRLKAEKQWPPK